MQFNGPSASIETFIRYHSDSRDALLTSSPSSSPAWLTFSSCTLSMMPRVHSISCHSASKASVALQFSLVCLDEGWLPSSISNFSDSSSSKSHSIPHGVTISVSSCPNKGLKLLLSHSFAQLIASSDPRREPWLQSVFFKAICTSMFFKSLYSWIATSCASVTSWSRYSSQFDCSSSCYKISACVSSSFPFFLSLGTSFSSKLMSFGSSSCCCEWWSFGFPSFWSNTFSPSCPFFSQKSPSLKSS